MVPKARTRWYMEWQRQILLESAHDIARAEQWIGDTSLQTPPTHQYVHVLFVAVASPHWLVPAVDAQPAHGEPPLAPSGLVAVQTLGSPPPPQLELPLGAGPPSSVRAMGALRVPSTSPAQSGATSTPSTRT